MTQLFHKLGLPEQGSYYLLSDGTRYARHGSKDAVGLLVLPTLDTAEHFRRTVGAGLPQFKPVEVEAREVIAAGLAAGGFCAAEGLRVTVVSTTRWREGRGFREVPR
jgi:hypothetical protein